MVAILSTADRVPTPFTLRQAQTPATQATPAAKSAPKATTESASAPLTTLPAPLTLTQLSEESLFQVREQAMAGNTLAIDFLAQKQAESALTGPRKSAAPAYGAFDLLA